MKTLTVVLPTTTVTVNGPGLWLEAIGDPLDFGALASLRRPQPAQCRGRHVPLDYFADQGLQVQHVDCVKLNGLLARQFFDRKAELFVPFHSL